MAFYCYSHAAMEADLSTNTFKVYHVLAKHANNKTRECFLRKEIIAKLIGKSVSTVNRALRELVQKGLMKKEYQYTRKGEQTANLYTLLDKPEIAVHADSQAFSMPKENPKKYTISTEIIKEDINGTSLKVYCYLKNHANKNGKSFLCIDSIAKDLKVCWRTVHRAIKELVKVGVISFKASFGRFSTFILKEQAEAAHPTKPAAKDYISAAQNHQFFSKIMYSLNKIFSMRI